MEWVYSNVESPEFGLSNVVRVERRVSFQGDFHVYSVRLVDVYVVLSVEPVERSRDYVTCWYGEEYKSGKV
jgi:hypothetical protein